MIGIGIIIVCILVLIVIHCWKNPIITSIPFKESIDLVNLPIVTFINNGIKLHFLLDTGSDDSYINVDLVESLNIKKSFDVARSIVTGNGNIESGKIIVMDISYKDRVFENAFVVSDMGEAFDAATGETGIKIHGILGSVFFARYKYILDYMKLEAYTKV